MNDWKVTDEFGIGFNPMPNSPGKLIARLQRRLISKHTDCMATLVITVIDADREADMRADFAVFGGLPETEKAAFLDRLKWSPLPYRERLLFEKSTSVPQLSLF